MFNIESFLEDGLKSSSKLKPTVIFPESLDPRVWQAIFKILPYANIVLLTDEKTLKKKVENSDQNIPAKRVEYLLAYANLVDIKKEKKLIAHFVNEYKKFLKNSNQKLSQKKILEFVKSPIGFSIIATKLGYADMVVGGLEHEPKEFFRPALNILKGKKDPFEVGIFVLPDSHKDSIFPNNIAIFSDIGVTTNMSGDRLASIAVGTCRMARDLFPESVLPAINGVIVSYSTKGSDEGPSVDIEREAEKLISAKLKRLSKRDKKYKNIEIETEVQVSNALGLDATLFNCRKCKDGNSSNANVVIVPNLDLGNFLYYSYVKRYPDSVKVIQIGGIDHKIVEFARNTDWTDIAIGVKANILRLWSHGEWNKTPNDYFFKRYKIFAINPGSTSTKYSYYEGDKFVVGADIRHSHKLLSGFKKISDQYKFRRDAILNDIKKKKIKDFSFKKLDSIVARGGLIRPVKSGIYRINKNMLDDLKVGISGEHASNLGGLIANEFGVKFGKPSFIVDPPVVDEVDKIALITGVKYIKRKVLSHALSQIATAKLYAEESGFFYNELNLIIAHLGGGISVGAHKKGRYIDVNNALNGEGPFSPERSGSLPPGDLIELCFSGRYSKDEVKMLNKGKGGLLSLLGTADFKKIEKQFNNSEKKSRMVVNAMAYQIAKEISSLMPAFSGEKVDRILITGGIAHSNLLIDIIIKRLSSLNIGVTVYPGQNEMYALVKNCLRSLQGKEVVKEYSNGDI